jgi:hypothetical protein
MSSIVHDNITVCVYLSLQHIDPFCFLYNKKKGYDIYRIVYYDVCNAISYNAVKRYDIICTVLYTHIGIYYADCGRLCDVYIPVLRLCLVLVGNENRHRIIETPRSRMGIYRRTREDDTPRRTGLTREWRKRKKIFYVSSRLKKNKKTKQNRKKIR